MYLRKIMQAQTFLQPLFSRLKLRTIQSQSGLPVCASPEGWSDEQVRKCRAAEENHEPHKCHEGLWLLPPAAANLQYLSVASIFGMLLNGCVCFSLCHVAGSSDTWSQEKFEFCCVIKGSSAANILFYDVLCQNGCNFATDASTLAPFVLHLQSVAGSLLQDAPRYWLSTGGSSGDGPWSALKKDVGNIE